VLAVNKKRISEVILELPKHKMAENIEQAYRQITTECDEFVYTPTKRYKREYKQNQIREAMVKGYIEMSQINLSICSECLHLEYEAEHMVERLVSGG